VAPQHQHRSEVTCSAPSFAGSRKVALTFTPPSGSLGHAAGNRLLPWRRGRRVTCQRARPRLPPPAVSGSGARVSAGW
jgi:hypothetical protein